MPAVTADTLSLPRLERLPDTADRRGVRKVVTAHRQLEGRKTTGKVLLIP